MHFFKSIVYSKFGRVSSKTSNVLLDQCTLTPIMFALGVSCFISSNDNSASIYLQSPDREFIWMIAPKIYLVCTRRIAPYQQWTCLCSQRIRARRHRRSRTRHRSSAASAPSELRTARRLLWPRRRCRWRRLSTAALQWAPAARPPRRSSAYWRRCVRSACWARRSSPTWACRLPLSSRWASTSSATWRIRSSSPTYASSHAALCNMYILFYIAQYSVFCKNMSMKEYNTNCIVFLRWLYIRSLLTAHIHVLVNVHSNR